MGGDFESLGLGPSGRLQFPDVLGMDDYEEMLNAEFENAWDDDDEFDEFDDEDDGSEFDGADGLDYCENCGEYHDEDDSEDSESCEFCGDNHVECDECRPADL